jgi:hypothetical protein
MFPIWIGDVFPANRVGVWPTNISEIPQNFIQLFVIRTVRSMTSPSEGLCILSAGEKALGFNPHEQTAVSIIINIKALPENADAQLLFRIFFLGFNSTFTTLRNPVPPFMCHQIL